MVITQNHFLLLITACVDLSYLSRNVSDIVMTFQHLTSIYGTFSGCAAIAQCTEQLQIENRLSHYFVRIKHI